jgi:type VI secretion system secreted protein Hcp
MNTPTHQSHRFLTLITLCAALVAASVGFAQNKAVGPDLEIYLQIDGILGDVTVKGFERQIAVSAFSWGASNPASPVFGGGGSAGKVNLQDLSLTKFFDSTSPQLFMRVATGTFLPKAVLRVVRTSGGSRIPYLTIELENVYISSLQMGHVAGVGENAASENLSLAFSKVKLTHTSLNGVVTETSWNVATNTP